ncbi:MAG: acyl-CoA dehydrogenase [Bacillota bacterium]
MDFHFTKEHQLLRKMVREFANDVLARTAAEIDETGRWPAENVKLMADLGLFGLPFPHEYGGAGAGEMGYAIALEEIGRVCTSTGTIVGAHTGIGAMAIYLCGTEDQKRKYLLPLARGEKLAAFALTEPNAGSDAAAIQTMAVRDGDEFVLNGTKIWITNGDVADVVTVMAVTDRGLGARGGVTAFIVEKGTPGFEVGSLEHKLGIRGSSTAELVFNDCRIPKDNVLGDFGAGFIVAMKTLDVGRIGLGAGCIGGAQACLDAACRFAKARRQFGKPIADNQAIQWMIADMATELEIARWFVYRTAWMMDTGQKFTREAAMVKLYCSEMASRAANKCLQIHGGMGYMKSFPVERMYRDARIAEIYEGTSEVQRMVIAGQVLRQY